MPRIPRKLIHVALDWTRPKDPPLSLGHASILANLQSSGVGVAEKSWAVNATDFNPHDVVEFALQRADPHTDFSLGAFVWNEKAVRSILQTLKAENFPGRVILGGPQVSYVQDNKALESYYPDADVFIRGYAEHAIAALLTSEKTTTPIKGVHYRGIPDLGGSATADLETLTSPFLTGVIPPQPFIRWETQRGCPFRCTFCQHREAEQDYLKRRHLSRTRIEAEADWIVRNPIIQDIAVLDPTFNSGPHYLDTLRYLQEGGYSGKIALQCRADMMNDEFLRAAAQLNAQARVVLEFGLQTIHPGEQRLIERPTNLKKFTKKIQECIAAGIPIEVSIIFGLPGQTLDSFKQTVDFCTNLGIPTIHAFPLMLLRGTSMFDQKTALGLVESEEIASPAINRVQTSIPHVISSNTFTHEDWRQMAAIAESLETSYNERETRLTRQTAKLL